MKKCLHYLYKIFFFILIVSVSSCEKEELTDEPLSSDVTENIQSGVKISSKSLAQFIEEDAKFKRSYSKFTSKRKGTQLKEGSDFEVNPSRVTKVEDSGKTTYTVAITKEDTPIGTFENLVIDVAEDETMQTYILSYIPDAEGIVEFENDSGSFKGTMTATPIDYDASDLLAQRHSFFLVTIMYCDVYGTTHLAGPGCTGAYAVTFAIPLGSVSSVASGNNNGITIVGDQNMPDPNFGGGGSMGGGTTSVPIMGEEENIIKKRNAVIAALKLHPGQKSWVNNNENNEDVKNIFKFLGENSFSDESTDFAKEAFEALREDGEVDWDEQIIKDESFIDTKADCVYEKFQERSSGFKELLNEFRTGDPVSLDLKFVVESIPPDDYGHDRLGTTSPPSNGIIDITINKDKLSEVTELNVALALIHEVIHADIHRTFINIRNNGITYDNLTSTELNQLIADNSFPELFEAIENHGVVGYHHDYMAQKYIEVMAAALKAYDNSAHNDGFYEDFAWQGLKNSEIFREKGLQEIRRIENVWNNHKNTGNKNCN